MSIVYLNGRFHDHIDAALDPLDRGMVLGDGLFETIRCEAGQLIFHAAHFARLARGARLLEIPWNMNSEELLSLCQQCLDANRLATARLRITVTRGELGNSPEIASASSAPTLLIHAQPFQQRIIDDQRERGWAGAVANFPVNHRSPLSEVKSTSYQEHLLARHFARRAGADEAIMLNCDGLLAEGAMSNIFIVKNGTVFTPQVEDGALPGIVRLKIGLICARIGVEYAEESLALEQLLEADEAFMTNSLVEVMPLVRVGERPLGNGSPGSVSRRLHIEHRRDVEQFLSALRGG